MGVITEILGYEDLRGEFGSSVVKYSCIMFTSILSQIHAVA